MISQFATEKGEAMLDRHQCTTSSYADFNASGTLHPLEELSRRWVAVYTATHHEKRVHQLLSHKDIQTFLPLHRIKRQWKKRPEATVELPLFPNYLFAHIERDERSRVLQVPGVLSIVSSGRESLFLPDEEVEAIRTGLQRNVIEPHPYIAIGERARIRSGCMSGMEGIVSRIKNRVRIVLTVTHMRQSFAVEIDAGALEQIPAVAN